MKEWMKCICPCFTPSRIVLAEGARETVSLPRLTLSTLFFFFLSLCEETDFYIERVRAHRIKINYHSCFHNSLPNSKTKLKLKHLWEQGAPLVFRGYSAYREDWLWLSPSSNTLNSTRRLIRRDWNGSNLNMKIRCVSDPLHVQQRHLLKK